MGKYIYRSFLPAALTFIAVISLSGCGPLVESLVARLTPSPTLSGALTQTAFSKTPVPTAAVSGTQDVLITPSLDLANCAYVQTNHTVSDISTQLNQEFLKAGLSEVEVTASAFGEDCIDTITNQVIRFSAIQTDFYITISVPAATDTQAMGEWIEKIQPILEKFPPGKVPGPDPGYVSITYTSGTDTVNLWVPRLKVKNLVDEGLKGSALYDALRGP